MASSLQLEKIEQAVNAGMDWIQIREKNLSGRDLAEFAEHAMVRAGSSSAVLVNDRVDVACAVGASGVHLGEHSLPADEAKRFVSQRCAQAKFIVGVSAHSLEGALQAERAGADYVIFGPVYATPSKAGFGKPQGAQRLLEVLGVECGDQLPVEVDVEGTLRVEPEANARFQVRLQHAGTAGHGLRNRFRAPLPNADIRLPVA